MMATKPRATKNKLTWSHLKRNLSGLDRNALLGLIHDLYAASKGNQSFLHARFGSGDDVLQPYKVNISRWVCPDVMRAQDISTAKASRAIADYKKACGRSNGMAELSVFYCEACMRFLGLCGMDDEGYFDALVRIFEQALKAVGSLEPDRRPPFLERLELVRRGGHNYGYWVGDYMDELMAEYGFGEE